MEIFKWSYEILSEEKKSEEIDEVANLAAEIWNQHFPSIIGQDQVDYMVSKFQSIAAITEQIQSGVRYYVLNHEGLPVGYMALIQESDDGRMMLSKIYVKQAARGRGLGKAMLDFAREQCRFQGSSKSKRKHEP